MQLQRTILRGAMVGGLLALAGLAVSVPTTQAAGDYGTCCTIIVNPPSVNPPSVNPPVVNPPNITPPSVNPPTITQSVPVVPIGGGGRSAVSSGGGGSLSSVSPVSSSVSPVSLSARPASAAPAPPAPVQSQVLGRTVEAPEAPVPPAPVAVVPRPIIEETAPRVVAPPEVIAETAPRTVQREVCIPGVGGAGMGPTCGEVLGRTVQGPGLVMARVLPKAGEGPSTGFPVWPPLALGGVALAVALVAVVLPRRRPSAQVA